MKCPVCGQDCVRSAKDLLATLATVFLPCADCSMRVLDKRLPPPDLNFAPPCSCGKRFIDEIFVHIYSIMVEEGVLTRADPLIAAGSPLVHPGFAMERPPFLPVNSLVLLSPVMTKKTALRLVEEVPEVRGVVKTGAFVPGLAAADLHSVPRVYELLAGCDVRADVFPLRTGPLVMYKQQSLVHIEFPRAGYPKIRSVEQHVGKPPVPLFVDACSGVGTLGTHGRMSWCASRGDERCMVCLGVLVRVQPGSQPGGTSNIRRVRIFEQIEDMAKHPVVMGPVKIAETEGDQVIEVYQGDFRGLHRNPT